MILHAGNHLIWFIAAGTSSKYLEVVSLVRSRAADIRCSVHLWLDCKCIHVYLTLGMEETLKWRRTLDIDYRNVEYCITFLKVSTASRYSRNHVALPSKLV